MAFAYCTAIWPRPPDAGDENPLAGPDLRLLQSLVDRDAGAKHRRGRAELQLGGQPPDEIGISQAILCEGAVKRIAGVLLAAAKRFPAGAAGRAAATGGVQPWNADPVPLLQPRDASADLGDIADAFVARNERRFRLHRPIPLGGMQVGVAHTRGLIFDEDLAGSWLRYRYILDHERLAELAHHSGFHGDIDLLRCSMLAPARPALCTSSKEALRTGA